MWRQAQVSQSTIRLHSRGHSLEHNIIIHFCAQFHHNRPYTSYSYYFSTASCVILCLHARIEMYSKHSVTRMTHEFNTGETWQLKEMSAEKESPASFTFYVDVVPFVIKQKNFLLLLYKFHIIIIIVSWVDIRQLTMNIHIISLGISLEFFWGMRGLIINALCSVGIKSMTS